MERYRTTIILIVALVALAGLAVFLQNRNQSAAVLPTPTPAPTVWEEAESVVSLDVISGTQTVSVRKDVSATVWSLIAPIKDKADLYQVGNVADPLKSLPSLSVITETADLAQFGLDKPSLKIEIGMGGAKPAKHTLMVGNVIMDGTGYYVKADDQSNVYVVSNSIIEPMKSWLTTPPKAQPSPTPFPTALPTDTPTSTPTSTNTPEPGSATATPASESP